MVWPLWLLVSPRRRAKIGRQSVVRPPGEICNGEFFPGIEIPGYERAALRAKKEN